MPTTAALAAYFIAHRNLAAQEPMAAYMRHQFEFLGIRTPQRRQLFRTYLAEYGLPADIPATAWTLWQHPARELQYVAQELLILDVNNAPPERLALYTDMVQHKGWWDTVDVIAPKLIGRHLQRYPHLAQEVLTWVDSDSLWLQRSAIIYQLDYKTTTDVARLTQVIRSLCHSKEFFIQKAIGWSLRQYARTAPATVLDLVAQLPLAPLSQREALKRLPAQPTARSKVNRNHTHGNNRADTENRYNHCGLEFIAHRCIP